MAPHVVIIGGGFGGLNCCQKLAKNRSIKITLIDRRNYHLFQPLLYQVATAGLSPADIAVPIRSQLSNYKNVQVCLGNVTKIDTQNNEVTFDETSLKFDYLVLACGANHSYFNHNEWEDFAPGLKTLEQATEIRRRILSAFERAETETDIEKQKSLLTFIVVGGGPTGVELAGAISEISKHTLNKDFRKIDPSRTRIILIEAGPRVLSSFAPELSRTATSNLESMGVQVWTNTRVSNITSTGVELGKEFIQAQTVIWAAGVRPSSLGSQLNTKLDSAGRVIVDQHLNIPNNKKIFVIGDMACSYDNSNKPLPGVATVAIQSGYYVANSIINDLKNKQRRPFSYIDKGQLATIGRSKAVMQFKNLKITGQIAWLMWLVIHIYYLIGFKNKLFVFIQWAWSYISFKKGARLITQKDWKSK